MIESNQVSIYLSDRRLDNDMLLCRLMVIIGACFDMITPATSAANSDFYFNDESSDVAGLDRNDGYKSNQINWAANDDTDDDDNDNLSGSGSGFADTDDLIKPTVLSPSKQFTAKTWNDISEKSKHEVNYDNFYNYGNRSILVEKSEAAFHLHTIWIIAIVITLTVLMIYCNVFLAYVFYYLKRQEKIKAANQSGLKDGGINNAMYYIAELASEKYLIQPADPPDVINVSSEFNFYRESIV